VYASVVIANRNFASLMVMQRYFRAGFSTGSLPHPLMLLIMPQQRSPLILPPHLVKHPSRSLDVHRRVSSRRPYLRTLVRPPP